MRSVISNVRQDFCCNQKLEFVFDALEKDDLEDIVQFLYRCEYSVENQKLSRDHHENCKTHPKGNFFLSIYFSITKELVRFFT